MAKRNNEVNEETTQEEVRQETTQEEVRQEATQEEIILIVKIPFTDKHNGKEYKLNDEIKVSKERAMELLNDERKLVIKK